MPKNFKLTLISIVLFINYFSDSGKPTVVVSIQPLYEITAALLNLVPAIAGQLLPETKDLDSIVI